MTERSAIEMWTGRWAWNPKTAVFTNPLHAHVWRSQTQDIEVLDGRLVIRNAQVFNDGTSRSWTFNGALDGRPQPITWDDDGSVLTFIGFFLLQPLMGVDGYYSPDGSFAGSEYFTVDADKVSVWGASTSGGKQFTYFEEWNRIP